MSNILRIQFPEDFEEHYNAYKAKILGQQAESIKKPPVKGNHKFPHRLTSGTKWENFILSF